MGDSFAPLVVQPPYFRFIERQLEKPVVAAVELLLRMTIKRINPSRVSVEAMRRITATLDSRLGKVEQDVTITSRQCDQVPVEWLDVPQSRPERIFLYLHGGAFAFRLPKMQTAMVARWCRALGARALMPRYRLAPEHPFPAGPDDCLAAYRWLLDHCADPRQIVIAGDSAGGNLTLVTMQRARDAGLPMPAAAVCLSPAVDFSLSGRSAVVNEDTDPIFTTKLLRWFGELYLTEPDLYMNPQVSPLVGDFSSLPPLLFQVGTKEILLDDSTRAAAKAHAAGVQVQLDVFDRMPHVFQAIPQYAETKIADANLYEFLLRHADWHRGHAG
jgi:epsilon-lactone hydrolase